jgi:hypothetical protein
MNQFDKFNHNLYYLLNPTVFQPSRFVNNKYGRKYTRSDYENDKTMGCRGTSFYLFASLTNGMQELNESISKRESLESYISKYELLSPSKTVNTEIDIPNKSIAIVSLFARVFEQYYVPWHTFILIRFDNPSGNNFKILQSWNDEELIISINELSLNWCSSPSDCLLSIVQNRDVKCWERLFGHKTVVSLKETETSENLKFQFNFQVLVDDIDSSWY